MGLTGLFSRFNVCDDKENPFKTSCKSELTANNLLNFASPMHRIFGTGEKYGYGQNVNISHKPTVRQSKRQYTTHESFANLKLN